MSADDDARIVKRLSVAHSVLVRAARVLPRDATACVRCAEFIEERRPPTARDASRWRNMNLTLLEALIESGQRHLPRGGFWRDLMRAAEALKVSSRFSSLRAEYQAALRRVGAPARHASSASVDRDEPRLNLLVLRCADIDRSRDFYTALGLTFIRERHGGGPPHYAATLGGAVLELYPRGKRADVSVRLGIELTISQESINRALAIGGEGVASNQESVRPGHVTLRDPDGHILDIAIPQNIGRPRRGAASSAEAYGTCGRTHVEVFREANDDKDAWELSVETPEANLRFSVLTAEVVVQMLAFFEEDLLEWAEIKVGTLSDADVLLVRDHPAPRVWLKVLPPAGLVCLEFADEAMKELHEAIRDACSDLS